MCKLPRDDGKSSRPGRVATFVALLALTAGRSGGATEPSITLIDETRQAATCDIAIALGHDDGESVAPVGYEQATDGASQPGAGEDSIAAPPAEGSNLDDAEAIVPGEPLAGSGGPPTWQRMLRPIGEVTANAALPPGLLPSEVEQAGDAPRAAMAPEVGDARLVGGWGGNPFEWSASKSWHRPLYFEEVNLERHGYQCHPAVQPLVSGAHFFLTVPTLPYQMTAYPPRECIYTLGHYRPGSCRPGNGIGCHGTRGPPPFKRA